MGFGNKLYTCVFSLSVKQRCVKDVIRAHIYACVSCFCIFSASTSVIAACAAVSVRPGRGEGRSGVHLNRFQRFDVHDNFS
jgi:hypothetical protein